MRIASTFLSLHLLWPWGACPLEPTVGPPETAIQDQALATVATHFFKRPSTGIVNDKTVEVVRQETVAIRTHHLGPAPLVQSTRALLEAAASPLDAWQRLAALLLALMPEDYLTVSWPTYMERFKLIPEGVKAMRFHDAASMRVIGDLVIPEAAEVWRENRWDDVLGRLPMWLGTLPVGYTNLRGYSAFLAYQRALLRPFGADGFWGWFVSASYLTFHLRSIRMHLESTHGKSVSPDFRKRGHLVAADNHWIRAAVREMLPLLAQMNPASLDAPLRWRRPQNFSIPHRDILLAGLEAMFDSIIHNPSHFEPSSGADVKKRFPNGLPQALEEFFFNRSRFAPGMWTPLPGVSLEFLEELIMEVFAYAERTQTRIGFEPVVDILIPGPENYVQGLQKEILDGSLGLWIIDVPLSPFLRGRHLWQEAPRTYTPRRTEPFRAPYLRHPSFQRLFPDFAEHERDWQARQRRRAA